MQASELTLPERRARAAQMIAFAHIKCSDLPDKFLSVSTALPIEEVKEIKRLMLKE